MHTILAKGKEAITAFTHSSRQIHENGGKALLLFFDYDLPSCMMTLFPEYPFQRYRFSCSSYLKNFICWPKFSWLLSCRQRKATRIAYSNCRKSASSSAAWRLVQSKPKGKKYFLYLQQDVELVPGMPALLKRYGFNLGKALIALFPESNFKGYNTLFRFRPIFLIVGDLKIFLCTIGRHQRTWGFFLIRCIKKNNFPRWKIFIQLGKKVLLYSVRTYFRYFAAWRDRHH